MADDADNVPGEGGGGMVTEDPPLGIKRWERPKQPPDPRGFPDKLGFAGPTAGACLTIV